MAYSKNISMYIKHTINASIYPIDFKTIVPSQGMFNYDYDNCLNDNH